MQLAGLTECRKPSIIHLLSTDMAAYKSIVYKEIVEINGKRHTLLECDYTDSINEAVEDGAISHPTNSDTRILSESEVIEYVRSDWA